jgi:hypothetical protein
MVQAFQRLLENRIDGVIVSVRYIVGLSPDRVKPKIKELVFVASVLSTQH